MKLRYGDEKMKLLKCVPVLLLSVALMACGGGGGGGATATATRTTITGMASKGPFVKGCSVLVYAVTNGTRGDVLSRTVTTDDSGSYSADLGNYSGPVMVEVSGSYRDEVTGDPVLVAASAPLRAVIPQAQGVVTLPVTPLTELAVKRVGSSLTPDAILAANNLVSEIFKVDIVNTLPVVPTTKAMATASQAQKDYTLALTAVSQLASESVGLSAPDKLTTALSALSRGISTSGMDSVTISTFESALSNYINSSSNSTGVTDASTTSLVNVGTLTHKYTLSLQGDLAAGFVKGIQFDLALPEGVTLNINSGDSTLLSSSLATAVTVPADAHLESRYAAGVVTVIIVTTQGLGSGGLITLTCNLPAGGSPPPASAFVVSNRKVSDHFGGAVVATIMVE